MWLHNLIKSYWFVEITLQMMDGKPSIFEDVQADILVDFVVLTEKLMWHGCPNWPWYHTVSCENCTCTGPPWRYWLVIQPTFNIKGKASCSWKKWNALPMENTDHTNIGHCWCQDKTLFAHAAEVFFTIGLNVDWLFLLVLHSLLQMLPTLLLLSATICWLFF